MIFNSLAFFVFIGIFLPLYFLLKGKARLVLCLVASYVFYGWWDERFLSLIAFSTILDYGIGLLLENENKETKRKRLLILSMIVNLGFLAIFKYFNFFADSFAEMLSGFGMTASWNTLNIILPVGISFYTFQSMSYTIDVYKREIPTERNFLRFATFISFFPQLVAGPIVRASEFLPQFQKDREFEWNRIISGLGQIIWGFFKKVAVADTLAPFVDQCFAAPDLFSSIHLLIGVIFYSFQIYCDFSGYSDIAIGLARMIGFDFPNNFKTPYFSQDFSEFWKRWHITLSSWLRDYLYIPLGGNRSGGFGSIFFLIGFGLLGAVVSGSWIVLGAIIAVAIATMVYMRQGQTEARTGYNYMNLMNTMLLGGLWHGASYVFIFWGFLHGLYLVVQRLLGPMFGKLLRLLHTPNFIKVGLNVLLVYIFTCLAWIYFRSPDFETANAVINGIISFEGFHPGTIINRFVALKGVIVIALLLIVDLSSQKVNFAKLLIENTTFRVVSFAVVLWIIAFFGTFGSDSFIYFQF